MNVPDHIWPENRSDLTGQRFNPTAINAGSWWRGAFLTLAHACENPKESACQLGALRDSNSWRTATE